MGLDIRTQLERLLAEHDDPEQRLALWVKKEHEEVSLAVAVPGWKAPGWHFCEYLGPLHFDEEWDHDLSMFLNALERCGGRFDGRDLDKLCEKYQKGELSHPDTIAIDGAIYSELSARHEEMLDYMVEHGIPRALELEPRSI